MPSFPKTETGLARRAAFLARRRQQYEEGRRLGLPRRQAGHLYNERQAAPKLLAASFEKPVAKKRSKGGTAYPDYQLRNKAQDYFKAEVYVRNALTGERRREPIHWTFTSRRGPLTRGDMYRAVKTQLDKRAEYYQNEALEVTSIRYVEEIEYDTAVQGPEQAPTQ
jgi:hypothetical protein